jgi:hypothetical protein
MTPRSAGWIALAAVALALTLWITAGASGLLYGVLYGAAITPGVALGRAIFGRHAAAWVGGGLIGYGTTALALWAAIAARVPRPWAFAIAWLAQAVLLVAVARSIAKPAVTLPPWTDADTRALCLVFLLVPALMGPPYRNLGITDAAGTRYYRAYFTADFVWHTALAAELGKYSMPPRNPFQAQKPIHYYWLYFVLPAVVAHDGPAPLRDVQAALKANAICSAGLIVAALFLLARAAVPSGGAGAAAVAVVLGTVAASAEGAWTLLELIRTGQPIAAVKDLNIDAITAWWYHGLRVDCLPRALWYNPQHSMACAFGVAALLVACHAGARASARAIVFAGVALGFSACVNPFVGAVFSLIYGVAIVWDALRTPGGLQRIPVHALAAVPVALAVAWVFGNKIITGAGSSMRLGFVGAATQHPIATLLLSTGPVLLPGVAGLWPFDGLDPRPRRVAAAGAAIALALPYILVLGDESWVGFRAGQILFLMLVPLLARLLWGLGRLPRGPALSTAVILLVAVAGLPTTVIDEYNAQDITNFREGPGFPWTQVLDRDHRDALEWLRRATPPTSIVQPDVVSRGRTTWSIIPSFAERRQAAGMPRTLVDEPDYQERSQRVQRMYATSSAREAADLAHDLRIDYVWIDEVEREAYPAGVAKFEAAPQFFVPAFRSGRVAIYHVP